MVCCFCGPLTCFRGKRGGKGPAADEQPAVLLEKAEAVNRELEDYSNGLIQRLTALEEKLLSRQADLRPQMVEFLVDQQRIDPSVVDFMTRQLQMSSILDFANYFSKAYYEIGVREEIVAKVAPFNEDMSTPDAMLQTSRLRAAWIRAQSMDTWSPATSKTAKKEDQVAELKGEHFNGAHMQHKKQAHLLGMGWTSPAIAVANFDTLWETMVYKARNPEKFMDVSDVVVVDRPGYIARAMTINATKKRVEEHIYASERKGEMVYRIVDSKTKHETEDERVMLLKEDPLRLEFFHRHVSNGYRSFWHAPVEPVRRMIQEIVAHTAAAAGKSQDTIGLGFLSEEIKDVSHDALWRSMVESIREPGRFFPCSDLSIKECKGFVERTLTANGKTNVEHCFDSEETCEIVYRKVVNGEEAENEKVVALRTHPLRIEFHQRSLVDGFRVSWDMPRSAPLGCVEAFVREAKRIDSVKPTTIGYGITSDPIFGCTYDDLVEAVELSIREPWRIMDLDQAGCSVTACPGYVQRRVKLSATGETVVERITVNEETHEFTYCKCDAEGQPTDVVRVLSIHTPLRLELYERNSASSVRVDWKAPYAVATQTFTNIVKLAKQLDSIATDTIGFGLASNPIVGMDQDEIWRAMLYTVHNPAECGMKVDSVKVQDKDGFLQRTMRLLETPGTPTVTDNIHVIEDACEINFRPVVNGAESEEERVFALRRDPPHFEMFCRHYQDKMRLDFQASRAHAIDVFRAVLSGHERR